MAILLGAIAQGGLPWGNYLSGNHPRDSYPGDNNPGAIIQGSIFRGATIWKGSIMLRDNCPVGAMIRCEIIQGVIAWGAIIQEVILPGGSCQDTDDCAIYERSKAI